MVEVDEADARVLRVVYSSGRFRNGGKSKRKGKSRAAFFDTCRNSNSRGLDFWQNQTPQMPMPGVPLGLAREGEGRIHSGEGRPGSSNPLGLGLAR